MHGIEFQPFINTKYHYPYLAKFLFIAGKKTLMKSFGLYASIKPRYDKTKNPVVSTGVLVYANPVYSHSIVAGGFPDIS